MHWKKSTRNPESPHQLRKTCTRSQKILRTNRTTMVVTSKSRPNARHYQRASKIFATNKERRAASRRHPTNHQNPKQQLQQTTATTTNAVIAKLWDICRRIAILASRQMHQWWINRAVHSNQTSRKLGGSRSSSKASRSSSKASRSSSKAK